MKLPLLTILTLLFASYIQAQQPTELRRSQSLSINFSSKIDELRMDGENSVIEFGRFTRTISPNNTISPLQSQGNSDIYVVKTSSTGQFLWHRRFGTPGTENVGNIKLDAKNNIYLGYTSILADTLEKKWHVEKLNPTGNSDWQYDIETDASGLLFDVVLHPSGGFYLLGNFRNYAILPDNPTDTIFNPNSRTACGIVVYVDSSRTSTDFKLLPSKERTTPVRGLVTKDDNLVVVGTYRNQITIDSVSYASRGFSDFIFLELDADLNILKHQNYGGAGYESVFSIKEVENQFYICGAVGSRFQAGDLLLESESSSGSIFTLDDNLQITSGTNLPTSSWHSEFFDMQITEDAIYTTGYINNRLSVLTVEDFILPTTSFIPLNAEDERSLFIAKYSKSYDLLWIQTLHGSTFAYGSSLVLEDDNITVAAAASGGPMGFIGPFDFETRISAPTFPSTASVTLQLKDCNLNPDISIDNGELTCWQDNAEYQWLSYKDSFQFISGATDQSYTPQKQGFYAVQISQNGCNTISKYVQLETSGIPTVVETVKSYPNPATARITIDLENQSGFTYQIINTLGEVVQSEESNRNEIDVQNLAPGNYTISVLQGDQLFYSKFIKL